MKEMFKSAWAQILLAIAVGILLISYKDDWPFAEIIHHLGTAFIVAAVVTGFWHLREVSEVIEKYVKSILLDYSYLTKLRLEVLMELRSKAAKAILEKAANNPRFKRDELEAWIDDILYKRLLPGDASSSGVYRENYVERITVEYLTLEEACRDERLPLTDILPEVLGSMIMRVTSITRYTVISPSISDHKGSGYPVGYSNTGSGVGVTNFPVEKLLTISVGNSQASATPLTLGFEEVQGQILSKAEPRIFKFDKDGTCDIWMRVVEYKSPLRESFVLNTMSCLTHNLRAYINHLGKGARLTFVGQMIATPVEKMSKPQPESQGAYLEYDGWLFEDHGYHFYWWTASEEGKTETIKRAPERIAERPASQD
jgi:hypothetical protein